MNNEKEKNENIVNGFSKRLRELRKQRNMSQTELGKRAKIHFTNISRYERGISQPSADALNRLAKVLGVSGDYLMDGSTNDAAKANFEDRDFLMMFKELEMLPDDEKAVVKKLIDAFLAKNKIKQIVKA